MKKIIIRTVAITIFTFGMFFQIPAFADDPPPPPGEHGQNTNQPPGGGNPVGGGVFILIALGAGYGAKKWYDNNKRKLAE